MNESRELARFVANLGYSDLPNEVVKKAENLILDQLGVELGCATKPTGRAVYRDAINAGGKGESSITYYGDSVPVCAAAFVNATFGHGFETDDIYAPGACHPGAVIVPAALALAPRPMDAGMTGNAKNKLEVELTDSLSNSSS